MPEPALIAIAVMVAFFIALIGWAVCAAAGHDDERWGRK